MLQSKYDIIVIGGGISGLSAAFSHHLKGHSVLVLESNQLGGVIQTKRHAYGLHELGPNTFALNEKATALIKNLQLEDKIKKANTASQKRYIFLNGKPTLINPKKLLFSNSIIGWKSKWNLVAERFRKPQQIENETLADVIRRRFDHTILERIFNPVISGIYAGDTEKLEYKSSMKRLYEMEQKFGSFTRGFFKSRTKRSIISFEGGLSTLITSLKEHLGSAIQYEEVLTIQRTDQGHEVVSSVQNRFEAKKVIIATPSYVTSKIIEELNPELSRDLKTIEYPSLFSMQFVYPENSVTKPLDSFGILIPKEAQKQILGIINYSSIFDGSDKTVRIYTVFVSINSDLQTAHIEATKKKAQMELEEMYRITSGSLLHSSEHLWEKAIPQMNVGHDKILQKVSSFEEENRGIEIIGNWRTGVALGDCIY